MTSFDEYLENICWKVNPSVLDDDMPDFRDNWLSNLDGEDYMKYGQMYGEETFMEGARSLESEFKKLRDNIL